MTEIPQVSEKYSGTVTEIALGKGDYVAGGAKGMPFLSFENPIRTRPMIAGEVYDTLKDYPQLAADMFDGRQKDPVEWAIMWKEIGADMICIRFAGLDPDKGDTTPEKATEIVRRIYSNYPNLVKAMADRGDLYRREVGICEQLEEEGKVVLIRPTMKEIGRLESDENEISLSYFHGYTKAKENIETIKKWV